MTTRMLAPEAISNILPAHIIAKATPSAQDGISEEIEKVHRTYGCELVLQAGTILRLPQVVTITGQNILNRFFYRKSLKRFDVFSIAMGALLLASKVEEQFKTLREILFAFHHIYTQRKGLKLKPMELGGQQYTTWKNELIMIERYILKELGFSLYNIMDHPHKYILYFIRVLNGSEELANIAWSYLNDSMRLDISLRYEAQTIACSAIYLAARKLGVVLPEDSETGAWWEVFGANTEHMRIISAEILDLYHSEKIGWLEPLAEVEYLSPAVCSEFDQILLEEEVIVSTDVPAVALSKAVSTTHLPFNSSSTERGDSTPPAGDVQSGCGSDTPPAGAAALAEKSEMEVQSGPRLERKWFSVVGDIDQMGEQGGGGGSRNSNPTSGNSRASRSVSRSNSKAHRPHYSEQDQSQRSDYHRNGSQERRRDQYQDRDNRDRYSRQPDRKRGRSDSRDRDSHSRYRRESSRDRRADRGERGSREGDYRDHRGSDRSSREERGDYYREDSNRDRGRRDRY